MQHAKDKDLIIWPIDAFDETANSAIKTAHVLKALSKSWEVSIEPVYIMSPGEFNVLPDVWPEWEETYRPEVEKRIASILKKCDLPNLLLPKIILSRSTFTRGLVQTLTDYAQKQSAELIAVATHARRGLTRLFMGSFAETLMLHSRVPILFVNPAIRKVPTKFNEILFPTDFSSASKNNFELATALASRIGTKIVLYHRYPTLFRPGEISEPDSYAQYEKEQMRKCKELGMEWAQVAKLRGVKAQVCIDTEHRMHADAIIEKAKSANARIIAMAPELGPLECIILGSITRQVARAAECPVWVLHSKF